MRTLAAALVIDPSAVGTVVCMRFDDVHAGRPAAVVVETVPEAGIGRAVMDRLRRAAEATAPTSAS